MQSRCLKICYADVLCTPHPSSPLAINPPLDDWRNKEIEREREREREETDRHNKDTKRENRRTNGE